jgi:hypothetical protein
MNHVLYDRIIEILKSGKQLTVNYTPYHKGCECELTTNVEDNALYDYLQNALEFWWYDDLIENYLIPYGIYDGGKFSFILNNDILNIEAYIHTNNDSYDDLKLYDYFDQEMIEILINSFEGKTIDSNHVLFTFENDGEKIENLEIVYLGENQDEYQLIEFDDQAFNKFEAKINSIIKLMRYYTKDIKNSFIWVSCNENSISITEDYPFNFELKREG